MKTIILLLFLFSAMLSAVRVYINDRSIEIPVEEGASIGEFKMTLRYYLKCEGQISISCRGNYMLDDDLVSSCKHNLVVCGCVFYLR